MVCSEGIKMMKVGLLKRLIWQRGEVSKWRIYDQQAMSRWSSDMLQELTFLLEGVLVSPFRVTFDKVQKLNIHHNPEPAQLRSDKI